MNNLKLYIWRFRTKSSIFALAENVDEAKQIAIQKADGAIKEEVALVIENQTPSEYDKQNSFIFEIGAQLFG